MTIRIKHIFKLKRFVIGGLFLLLLSACAWRSGDVSPPLETPQAFSDSGRVETPQRWWATFGDTAVDSLVENALSNNFDLLTAWQRVREAQAVTDRASASFFPDLFASLSGEVRRPEVPRSEDLTLGLSSEYELDLWGRVYAGVEAARFREEASRYDYQTAAISISAEVVRAWYRLAEARSQRDLLAEQIGTNEKVLRLIRNRFGSGQIRSVDILRQKQLLEATREQRIAVESEIGVLEHRLAVLVGRSPQDSLEYAGNKLPQLPPLPATGLPLELVNRRPDVQVAFNRLRAADRDLAVAAANRYPRLTISASATSTGNDADALMEDWVRTLSAGLLGPIFAGGERSAEVERTEAAKKQRLYEYGQTILIAFREVEDALIREKKQRQRIASIEQQVEYARQTYEQLQIEYLNGISDYLDVLTTLTEQQRLQRELLSAKLLLLEYRIALHRALAGGFETAHTAN